MPVERVEAWTNRGDESEKRRNPDANFAVVLLLLHLRACARQSYGCSLICGGCSGEQLLVNWRLRVQGRGGGGRGEVGARALQEVESLSGIGVAGQCEAGQHDASKHGENEAP